MTPGTRTDVIRKRYTLFDALGTLRNPVVVGDRVHQVDANGLEQRHRLLVEISADLAAAPNRIPNGLMARIRKHLTAGACAGSLMMSKSPESWRRFGQRLKRTLATNVAMELLPKGTWVAGGCHTLMKALSPLFHGSRPMALIGDRIPGLVEHVVLDVRGGYLDGDGFSTLDELVSRWSTIEMVKNPRLIPYRPEELSEGFDSAPDDMVTALRTLLRECLITSSAAA